MSPPRYSDLLSRANDVLLRGMHYGWWRFLCNTRLPNDLQFITTGESNLERKVIGCFKWRKLLPAWNMILSQRYWSSKDITTQLSLLNKPWAGLYMAIGETYNWDSEKWRTHFKLAYANDFLNFTSFSAYEDKMPPVNAAVVLGKDEYVAGLQSIFDLDEKKLKVINYCLGYVDPKFAVHGFFNTGNLSEGQEGMKQLVLSVWNHFNDYLDLASLIRYRKDSNEPNMEFGVKYKVDDKCFLRVKLDNEYQMGVGMQQALYAGITLFLATRFNISKFSEGGHKLGVGLELLA